MTIMPAGPSANFNLAVETLKRTLKHDKVAAAAFPQAQAPPVRAGQDVDVSSAGSNPNLGQLVNTDA